MSRLLHVSNHGGFIEYVEVYTSLTAQSSIWTPRGPLQVSKVLRLSFYFQIIIVSRTLNPESKPNKHLNASILHQLGRVVQRMWGIICDSSTFLC